MRGRAARLQGAKGAVRAKKQAWGGVENAENTVSNTASVDDNDPHSARFTLDCSHQDGAHVGSVRR